MGTTTTDDFLRLVSARTENGDRLQVKHAARLIRMAERLQAIEAALRSDPGHAVTAAVVEPMDDRTKSVSDWKRMGRAMLASTGPFEAGVCRVCGCTEATGCEFGRGGPCSWVEGTEETLCDNPTCMAAALASGMIESDEKPEPMREHGSDPGPCYDAGSDEFPGLSPGPKAR